MPIIIAPDDWTSWLRDEPESVRGLMKPAPMDDLVAYPVRSKIEDDDPPESLVEEQSSML
jgi:putative SOS response-associated peptidase YedK